MPNTTGSQATATLMLQCGNNVSMNWGNESSGAQTSAIEHALEVFGYSTEVEYQSYYADAVSVDINANRPVILDGFTSYSCFWAWCWPSGSGHAWVADGFHRTDHPCWGTNTSFHMNWGWGGSHNGMFYNPDPPPWNFQHYRKMLYKIHL